MGPSGKCANGQVVRDTCVQPATGCQRSDQRQKVTQQANTVGTNRSSWLKMLDGCHSVTVGNSCHWLPWWYASAGLGSRGIRLPNQVPHLQSTSIQAHVLRFLNTLRLQCGARTSVSDTVTASATGTISLIPHYTVSHMIPDGGTQEMIRTLTDLHSAARGLAQPVLID